MTRPESLVFSCQQGEREGEKEGVSGCVLTRPESSSSRLERWRDGGREGRREALDTF